MDPHNSTFNNRRWSSASGAAGNSWSIPSTALIGRSDELDDIVQRLSDPATRLLTLTGPGGVGKTRLAIAVLERLANERHVRTYFVSLASISDPAMVPNAVAWAMTGYEPVTTSALAAISRAVGSEPALIVLDNFEHLMPAAGFVVDLLSATPAARVLVTSRETLRLRVEQAIAVSPLPVPGDPARNGPDSHVTDAMTLFIECVQTIRPGYLPTDDDLVVIGAICRRLDGLPLAIELAAARSRALSPRALLGRLDARLQVLSHGPRDLPERQRTMRDTIEWSCDLLHEQDRAIFRRLSVFAGAFTLEAAEAVLGGEGVRGTRGKENEFLTPLPNSPVSPAADVLDAVSSLLDKNLLRERVTEAGEQSFSMLQTIREFALEEFEASGEAEGIRSRHADWCVGRTAACWLGIYREEFDTSWFAPLEEEHDDFRAALTWLERTGDGHRMLQIAVSLAPFWFFHSHRVEGLEWIERARARFNLRDLPDDLHARMTHCIGLLLHGKERALAPLAESIELCIGVNDRWGIGACSITSAVNLNALGRFDEAKAFAKRAIECFEGLDEIWLGSSSLELGISFLGLGELSEARSHIEQEIAIGRAHGDWYGFGQAANALCLLSIDQKDFGGAKAALADAIDSWNKLGMLEGIANALAAAAILAGARGDHSNAAALLGAFRNVSERIEYVPTSIESVRLDATKASCQRALKAEFASAEESGAKLSVQDAIQLALSVGMSVETDDKPVARERPRFDGLTPREVEVLRLLAEGRSDREIGEGLFISRATAARHIANIFAKIDVNTRTAAAAYAFRHGLTGRSE